MKRQLDLIRETDWHALLVLDACRADAFHATCNGGAEVVRAPGVCTPQWVAAVGPELARRDALWVTANPVVDREVARLGLEVETVSAWQSLWGRWTAQGIPSVHPLTINGLVVGMRGVPAFVPTAADRIPGARQNRARGVIRADRPIVVHYMQPHSPYIGSPPLGLSRWGGSGGGAGGDFGAACHALQQPERAVRAGDVSWADVREAYLGNLRLVWGAARRLAAILDGLVVITSDHGELLGEQIDGQPRFGHEGHWRHGRLFEVPWLAVAPGASPQPDDSMQRKLEALGYA